MYASFFGLRELPFNNTPDPRFFFSTPDHEEALASLIYAIGEGKGFVLLTGEVGSGKTLVTRLMLRHFGDSIEFAGINNTQVTANELLRCVCSEFNLDTDPSESGAELIRALQDFLLRSFASNKPVVLMLDEAQALSREAFEQVRMIGNLEADDAKLLQIVIVGQPELRERFEADDMRQLRQRIFRSFHLSALTRQQTEGYIRHRLGVAGVPYPEQIIDSSAVDVIYGYAQGLPRLINTVCDNVLLSAYAADERTIDNEFVRHVISQMMTVVQGGPRFASPRVPVVTSRKAVDDFSVSGIERSDDAVLTGGAEEGADLPREQRADGRRPNVQASDTRDSLHRTVERAVEVEAEIRSLIERAQKAESRIGPHLDQLQKLAVLVRRLLGETKSVTADARELMASTRSARASTEQSLAQLSEQTVRTARLTVSLREIFDKLEGRAERLSRQTHGAHPKTDTGSGDHESCSRTVAEKRRSLDRAISQSRNIVQEVRSLIEATSASPPEMEPRSTPRLSAAGGSRTRPSPSSQLAAHIKELTAMISSPRTVPRNYRAD